MKVESVASTAGNQVRPRFSPAEEVAKERKAVPLSIVGEEKNEDKVAAEEMLDRIKKLTEDGVYSVRFELDKDVEDVIIKLVDSKSGDLIRQIPPEEILGLSKKLRELRGLMVNTQG